MILLLPNTSQFWPQSFDIQVVGNIQINTSPLNGSMQTVEFPGDRRLFRLHYGPRHNSDMAPLRAFWNRFRGQAHTLRLWNLAQPKPLGGLSGTATLTAPAPAGSNSVTITSHLGASVKPGDWIGITSSNGTLMTVEVVDTTGTSQFWAQINPPLRLPALTGAAVVWDRPTIDCLLTAAPVIPHGPGSANQLGVSEGFSVEAVEFLI